MNRRQFLTTASTSAAVSLAAPSTGMGMTNSPAIGPSAPRQLISQIIHGLPKAELHIHFEGLLEAAVIIRLSEQAMELLKESEGVRDKLIGIGLDHPEVNAFPQKFAGLYARAREMDYRLTAHCDVNQPESYQHIRDCIEVLGVERIDHGVRRTIP